MAPESPQRGVEPDIDSLLLSDPIHSHSDRGLADVAMWSTDLECGGGQIQYLEYPCDQIKFEDCVRDSRPAIIMGVMEADSWPASSRWSSSEALIRNYGELIFSLKPGLPLSLKRYVEYALTAKSDYPFYLSARGEFEGGLKALLDDYVVPSWFREDVYDWLGMNGSFRYFICGGQRTGTNMHVDPLGTCAWNTSVCGHKRWVLFPPGDADEYRAALGAAEEYQNAPPACWFLDVYPGLRDRAQELGMIECIQRPGETIFVPAGWWHIVLNLDLTIAITMNHMLPAMLPQALQDFEKASPTFARMIRQESRKLHEDRRKRLPCLEIS